MSLIVEQPYIFPRSSTHSTDIIVAKHAIRQHQMKVISGRDEEDRQRVHVRRSNLVKDTIKAFSKPTFDVSKMLKVTFIPEGSVDDGGPRREFFQLAMKECMKTSFLFTGWPENVVPQHNVEAVANNTYFIVGKLIATCIVQGGQPPVCFAKAVADFLIYNEVRSKACLEDIPDCSIRDKLRQVISYFYQLPMMLFIEGNGAIKIVISA